MVKRDPVLSSIGYLWIFLDGIALTPKSPTDWYWTENGDKISFEMPWLDKQPDTYANNEWYLSIGRFGIDGPIGFNDISGRDFFHNFLCQKYI